VDRTLVEVESTIGPPGVCSIGVDEMIARSELRTGPLGVAHREPELHDHALLLAVNAFKDKLVLAMPWVREDLIRIARAPGFSAALLVERAREAKLRTLLLIVADWLASDERAQAWADVRRILGPATRARYTAWYGALARGAPEGAALSVLARMASDDPWMRAKALGLGGMGTLLRVLRRP
jgi:hypothetical protein